MNRTEIGSASDDTVGGGAPRRTGRQLAIVIRDRGQGSGTRIRAKSPGALLSVVPLLLGFKPESSIVLLGTQPPKGTVKVTLRYDLPDAPDPDGVPFDLAEVPPALGEDVPVLASRAAVAASIAPVTGLTAESMRQATGGPSSMWSRSSGRSCGTPGSVTRWPG